MNAKPTQEFYATRTMAQNVKHILGDYNRTGKIGAISPRSDQHAKRIARGIAKSTRQRNKSDE